MIRTNVTLVFCFVFCLAFAVGCGAVKEIKQARKDMEKVKVDTKRRLKEIQIRGEMDFELQESFAIFSRAYHHVWAAHPVKDWAELVDAESELGVSGIRLSDAKKKGIVPIFNVPFIPDEKVKMDTIIGYAPTGSADQYWVMFADEQFSKLSMSEIEAATAGK